MTRNSQPHIAYFVSDGELRRFEICTASNDTKNVYYGILSCLHNIIYNCSARLVYFLINTKNTIAEHCSKVQQINAYFDCSLRIATHRVVQFLPWSQDDRLSHLKYF